MALTPIEKKQKVRDFITYDLEWSRGEKVEVRGGIEWRPQVRMAGCYDRKQGFRWYKTITDFLNGELTSKNRGKWFYAHAGGLADMLFVLEWLADNPAFEVQASFSGSSAIIVHVRKGRNVWHFIDSYWLLPNRLADIAKTIGMEKGDVDSFDDTPLSVLVPYNELDCRILWEAINAFEDELLALGGQLQMTLASCSMFLFRRRFLRREIRTSAWLNEKARQSYFASRVEVFKLKCENAFYYDINSSFPHAMTRPQPGNLEGSTARLSESRLMDPDYLILADCTVTVPEMYFPPLPFRNKQSVYFPTGTWRNWFVGVDLELLLDKGGRIDKVHEVIHFEPFDDLAMFAQTMYEERLKAQKAGDEGKKYRTKILLNSLYGKFGEGSLKTSLLLNPASTDCPHWPKHDENECMEMLFPGAFLVDNEVDVPHAHVIISSYITAIARRNLYEPMDESGDIYYCDTDGFATTKGDLPTGDNLGELKLEKVIKNGRFIRPKVYQLDDKVRAKGFTLKPDKYEIEHLGKNEREEVIKSRQVEKFLKLLNGHEIEMRRFSRVKELYRKGLTTPTERIVRKALRNKVRPKRRALPNGDTRPWSVSELERIKREEEWE